MNASEILNAPAAPNVPAARLSLRDVMRAVRTRQWAKNALLLAGFLFAGRLRAPAATLREEGLRVALGMACFCALSAAAYLINDWKDVERDREHPLKRHRPLAAGRMSLGVAALLIAGSLLVAALTGTAIVVLAPQAKLFGVAALFYFALTLGYSFALKHEVIIDVLCVALGFVVRVIAGCLVVPVKISPWIIFCTFMLALFIALCKRRAELLEMGESRGSTRRVLDSYTVPLLDTCIAVASGLTITSYSLYTFSAHDSTALPPKLRPDQAPLPLLMLTIPFVIYGVFRFLLLAHSSPVGGEPEQMLRDRPLMINALLWGLTVALLTVL